MRKIGIQQIEDIALGAEGIGKDVTMIIGNGYTKNHAQITLDVLRENPKLRKLFDEKYC